VRPTHAGRLERWVGAEKVRQISEAMRDWYGPPIALAQVPGRVYATRGGDFCGPLRGGYFASLRDFLAQRARRVAREWSRRQARSACTGFSSLSDLISEATAGGKSRYFAYQKVGTTGVVAATNSLWRVGNQPVAGAAASAAPGGIAPTDATTGAWPFTNPTGGDTQHFVRWDGSASVVSNTLLLYDRIFAVAKTMNSTATEAVTGVPTRYQNTTGGAVDSAEGNFLFVECGTVLPATAHNWTVCLYTGQGGTTGVTLPSLTGNSANIVNRLDQPVGQWFAPLASGDTGILALTQMQCSALVASGAIDFVIGHPLAFLMHPVANSMWGVDGINSAFNLTRIFDDAALAFLEIVKPATGATTYTGLLQSVAG
jgi:hypothetical protein